MKSAGTTAWFHCFAGTAGDMTLASLVHAGADPTEVAKIVSRLPVDNYALSFEPTMRCGLAATRAIVAIDEHHGHHHDHDHGHRAYAAIRDMLAGADLPDRVRDRAQKAFLLLAEIEGEMHGVAPELVEFHEVGSVDAIVDIVGTCAALEVLGIDRIVCSPITVGQGTVHAAHGELPNPTPAVMALLARRGAPSRGIADPRELATPTGVALMTALADEFGPMPAMTVGSVGYGAGTSDIEGRPNVVQVVLGNPIADRKLSAQGQPAIVLEVNVDDVTGEVIAHTINALLTAGAFDAWATPIVMKKGRPAHTVHALCDQATAGAIGEVLLRETGSLGLRGTTLMRWPQRRDESTVQLHGHPIRVKMAAGRAKVEHDDAAVVAAALGMPLREVIAQAERLAADS
ncbi:MAG: nickel pincer cofactor biosynthesis protein LarC [Ilumatobacteraceae bacterium]